MNPLVLDATTQQNSKIIVALDYNNEKDVINFISQINPLLCKLKVGKELFTACGPKLVEKLVISGFDVFLDLKFHDIPNTVYKACKVACNLGVWMLNVHASGGETMLKMAKQAVDESDHKPLLIAVTVLTSMTEAELSVIGITNNLLTQVKLFAKLSNRCNLDGVVCSAHESLLVKETTHNSFLTVTPGIRLITDKTDDQTRIVTPQIARQNLVDYMVIGRPITQAIDPIEVLTNINRMDLDI